MGYTEDLQAKMARLKSGEPKVSRQETITKAVNQIRENTGLPIPNLVTNAINSVPTETANKLVKQNYDTRLQDKMARLKGTVQQVQQPVQNIVQEPVIPQAVTPTFVGAAALQESNIQKKASDIKAKFKQGEALTDNDMKILAQAQHDKQLEKEVDYRAGKKEAEKVPTLAPVLTENGLGNSLELLRAKNNPVTRYDKNYGIQEAKEEFKTLDFNNNKNGEKYLEYKEGLEEAQKNNDTRNIAKYSGLLQAYKDTFKAKYGNTKDNTDLVSIKNSINDLYKDRQDIISRFNKSQDQNERLRIAEEYNRVNDLIQSKTKLYSDALAYDEIVNNNIISDSAKSLWKNTLGGTANAINAAYAYGSKGLGLDATSLNADALLAYNGGENFNINDVTNILNKTNPVSMVATNATGFGQGAAGAFNTLQTLAGMYPNNKRLTNLYNEIKNHSYKGTSEDLKKELDTIQQELYQGFKDEFTQDEIDKVADQLRHNEIYGDYKAIPNAFGTVGNMIPSILVGTATGGLGELGGATANVAQQIGSYGTLGLGAASSGMDKALQEGANYNQALAYGALSGATEVGTEMLGGETVNKVFGQTGKTALGKLFGKTIDNLNLETKVGKFIANQVSGVTEEMTEEMISEALDPLWQQLTYNQNALPKNLDEVGEYFKNILNAGIEAIPSTLLMQGGGMLMKARNVQTVENGMIDSINQSNLSQTTKNELINEVKKAARDVKLGIQESESDNIREQITEGMDSGVVDRAASELVNKPNEVQSIADKVKAKELNVPESTQGLLQYVQDHRSGLNIELDDTIKGNGTHTTTNEDGTRTIRINPKSENAVEVILAHELGHDFKGTKFYSDLQDTVLKYAEGLPQFKEALEALDKTYKDGQVTYNLNDEATNDILAQALGNQEFLNTLAQAKPNLFERIYNWFKNVLFDGNNSGLNLEQRRLLNKMEQGFRNAYQTAYEGKGNETSNSLSEKTKRKMAKLPKRKLQPTTKRNKNILPYKRRTTKKRKRKCKE